LSIKVNILVGSTGSFLSICYAINAEHITVQVQKLQPHFCS